MYIYIYIHIRHRAEAREGDESFLWGPFLVLVLIFWSSGPLVLWSWWPRALGHLVLVLALGFRMFVKDQTSPGQSSTELAA